MEERLSAEEMQKIVQAAHIAAPGISEEYLEKLFQSEAYLAKPGFAGTFWSLIELQEKKGVSIPHALKYCEDMIAKFQQLEKDVAWLKQEHDTWKGRVNADVQASIKTRQERVEAEKDLAAFRRQVEAEKKQLADGVDKARQEAEVNLEEIAETQTLKADANSRGLTVKFLLDICHGLELAPDTVERLQHEIEINNSLAEANIERKKELGTAEGIIAQSQEKIAQLEKKCGEKEEYLADLRKDKAQEDIVHGFYRRFLGLKALMEYVVSWDRIGFALCKHPVCQARFWIDRNVSVLHLRSRFACPACGGTDIGGDIQAYRAVGHFGTEFFIKLKLGE